MLAACALVSLEEDWMAKLRGDNENCKWVGEEVAGVPGIELDPETIETNILRFKVSDAHMKKIGFKNKYFDFVGKLKEEHGILSNPGFFNENIRFVTHRDVNKADCEKLVKAIKKVLA